MKFICPHAYICPSSVQCEHQIPHNKNTLCILPCVDNSDVDVGICVEVPDVLPEELFDI